MNGRAAAAGGGRPYKSSTNTTKNLLLLLLLPIALPFVTPAAEATPHLPPIQRPQYIEAIRPVIPNQPMGLMPPNQQVVMQQQLPENVPPPRKRAAIVLDKLMFALQKALDDTPNMATTQGQQQQQQQQPYPRNRALTPGTMDLQRRGNNDGRLYWRCYFNAVSCF